MEALMQALALAWMGIVVIIIALIVARVFFGRQQPRTTSHGEQPANKGVWSAEALRGGPGLLVSYEDWKYNVEAGLVDWPHPDEVAKEREVEVEQLQAGCGTVVGRRYGTAFKVEER